MCYIRDSPHLDKFTCLLTLVLSANVLGLRKALLLMFYNVQVVLGGGGNPKEKMQNPEHSAKLGFSLLFFSSNRGFSSSLW